MRWRLLKPARSTAFRAPAFSTVVEQMSRSPCARPSTASRPRIAVARPCARCCGATITPRSATPAQTALLQRDRPFELSRRNGAELCIFLRRRTRLDVAAQLVHERVDDRPLVHVEAEREEQRIDGGNHRLADHVFTDDTLEERWRVLFEARSDVKLQQRPVVVDDVIAGPLIVATDLACRRGVGECLPHAVHRRGQVVEVRGPEITDRSRVVKRVQGDHGATLSP